MGSAPDWQSALAERLRDVDVDLLNPRRDDWDFSWEQRASHPQFRAQVTWELDGLERADVIAIYLAPGSSAPISLLELGLFARGGRLIVCCGEGFYRLGNVELVCERYGATLVRELDALAAATRERLDGGSALAVAE